MKLRGRYVRADPWGGRGSAAAVSGRRDHATGAHRGLAGRSRCCISLPSSRSIIPLRANQRSTRMRTCSVMAVSVRGVSSAAARKRTACGSSSASSSAGSKTPSMMQQWECAWRLSEAPKRWMKLTAPKRACAPGPARRPPAGRIRRGAARERRDPCRRRVAHRSFGPAQRVGGAVKGLSLNLRCQPAEGGPLEQPEPDVELGRSIAWQPPSSGDAQCGLDRPSVVSKTAHQCEPGHAWRSPPTRSRS